MANTAALLGNLLNKNADYNYYAMQQIYWNNMYEANSAKLNKQTKYEEKWESAFDDAQNVDKQCKIGNTTWKEKDQVLSDAQADAYAHAKVKEYNESLSLELADLDLEYDTMRNMYETLMQELQSQKESAKSVTSTAAQDTGLLQS